MARVHAPSLIIVAGDRAADLTANESAFHQLECPKQLVHIGAGRFTPTGDADAEVSRLALDWFTRMLATAEAPDRVDEYC
jgi:hypothetical protein